jgi:hypothetical protein
MLSTVAGLIVLIATSVVFWLCLPVDGRTHRLVGTAWEPYVAVAFCGGIALSFTMVLAGVFDLLGG